MTGTSEQSEQTEQVDTIIAEAARRLRARGERMTGPRRAVLSALAAMPGHAAAEEVVTAVAAADPGVHRASVYRALEALSDLDLVQHVHLGHGATTYHLVAGTGRHPHAQCRRCGRVLDLPEGLLGGVARRLAADTGFVLDGEHVALSGWCADCHAAAET